MQAMTPWLIKTTSTDREVGRDALLGVEVEGVDGEEVGRHRQLVGQAVQEGGAEQGGGLGEGGRREAGDLLHNKTFVPNLI